MQRNGHQTLTHGKSTLTQQSKITNYTQSSLIFLYTCKCYAYFNNYTDTKEILHYFFSVCVRVMYINIYITVVCITCPWNCWCRVMYIYTRTSNTHNSYVYIHTTDMYMIIYITLHQQLHGQVVYSYLFFSQSKKRASILLMVFLVWRDTKICVVASNFPLCQ